MRRRFLQSPPQPRRSILAAAAALVAVITGVLTVVLLEMGVSWPLTFGAAAAAIALLGWLAASAADGRFTGFVIAYSCAFAVLLWPAVWLVALLLFGQGD